MQKRLNLDRERSTLRPLHAHPTPAHNAALLRYFYQPCLNLFDHFRPHRQAPPAHGILIQILDVFALSKLRASIPCCARTLVGLPFRDNGIIKRGSLLERTIRNHARNCAKCTSGEGHRLSVLTVSYPGGRTRQFSLRREMVPVVRRWLANYQRLREASEAICELNHDLRVDESGSTPWRKRRD
jgi:hypothetical protein